MLLHCFSNISIFHNINALYSQISIVEHPSRIEEHRAYGHMSSATDATGFNFRNVQQASLARYDRMQPFAEFSYQEQD